MLGGETVGEGEFESVGRLLRVVVVERRWLILLVSVNYFGASGDVTVQLLPFGYHGWKLCWCSG